MSNTWLRLSANFNEHPKMLRVRADAGPKADSAELGWYRILMAAKRYGRWNFASEDHLAHIAGPFYRFVPFYRAHGLLDDLTIHDGESYNAVKTDAERTSDKRERDRLRDEASRGGVTDARDIARDTNVTLEREREEREDKERERARAVTTGYPNPDDDRDALDLYHVLTNYRPWGEWSGDAIRGLISDYTDATVQTTMRAEFERQPDRKDLLKNLQARLARDAERAKRDRPQRPRALKRTPDEEAAYQQRRREVAGFDDPAPIEEFVS